MKCISFWPKWDVHFGQNEMEFISFRPEWNGHFIPAERKWMPFHFGQNEMVISFRPKWNVIFLIVLRNMRPGQLSWKSGKIQLAMWSSVLSRTQLLSPSVALLAKLVAKLSPGLQAQLDWVALISIHPNTPTQLTRIQLKYWSWLS